MRVIKRHKLFLKDFARCQLSDQHFSRLMVYLACLVQETPLPLEARDHPLVGQWAGFREFHISGDVLVIYRQTAQDVTLVCMGSHAQLFE